jgi:1-aminocyclopropane-1-carboxylate deaminase/D-cysteine desulfhydrase-like pyridoxal-dependent ACC family enzyme
VELGQFPSKVEKAKELTTWIKRDDDLARLFGGGKVRKLELYFGEAKAQGKKRIITSGGVGSNQTLAVALLGPALGFSVRMHLAPQPTSTLTAKNLAADAATRVEMRLFSTVTEGHAQALRDAQASGDAYVIPPGGTTPLGTLGFVNAGLELFDDIQKKRLRMPRRVYIALGLGGSTAGLAIGFALAEIDAEIVAVRTSNPATVTKATLRAIHNETIAFLRMRDPSFPAIKFESTNVRIEDRFVGGGYGAPTTAGNNAIDRAKRSEGWELDPVYTGKAFAALLEDVAKEKGSGDDDNRPILFWNTASSRPLTLGDVPSGFERFAKL